MLTVSNPMFIGLERFDDLVRDLVTKNEGEEKVSKIPALEVKNIAEAVIYVDIHDDDGGVGRVVIYPDKSTFFRSHHRAVTFHIEHDISEKQYKDLLHILSYAQRVTFKPIGVGQFDGDETVFLLSYPAIQYKTIEKFFHPLAYKISYLLLDTYLFPEKYDDDTKRPDTNALKFFKESFRKYASESNSIYSGEYKI